MSGRPTSLSILGYLVGGMQNQHDCVHRHHHASWDTRQSNSSPTRDAALVKVMVSGGDGHSRLIYILTPQATKTLRMFISWPGSNLAWRGRVWLLCVLRCLALSSSLRYLVGMAVFSPNSVTTQNLGV